MSTETQRDNALDGLRGLAALGVVLSHFILLWYPAWIAQFYTTSVIANPGTPLWQQCLAWPPVSLLFSGSFQVLVFFVLSGYVLVLPFWNDRPEILQDRLVGRYIRLNLPVAASTLFAFILSWSGLMYNRAIGEALPNQWFAAFYRSNTEVPVNALRSAAYHSILLGSRAFNPPVWSIHYEFYGSVVLLALYRFLGRWNRLFFLVPIALLAWLPASDVVYYLCFILGAALGGCRLTRLRPIAWLLVLCGFWLGSRVPGTAPIWLSSGAESLQLLQCIAAVLLVASVCSGLGTSVLSSRPLVFLGRVSYSAYLIHFPLLASFVAFLQLVTPSFPGKLALLLVVYLALVYSCAELFTRHVDEPAIKLARTFNRLFRPRTVYKGQ